MTKNEWNQRMYQERQLAALGLTPEDGQKLRRISNRLRRIGEIRCNEPLTEAQDAKLTREEERLESRAKEIVTARGGAKVYVQGDPRGCALYVIPRTVLDRYDGQTIDSIYNNGIAVY